MHDVRKHLLQQRLVDDTTSPKGNGHGFYHANGQGHAAVRNIHNNMLLANWSQSGQFYGSGAAVLDYLDFRDNIFDNLCTAWAGPVDGRVLIGGKVTGNDWQVHDNLGYGGGSIEIGYGGASISPDVIGVNVSGNRVYGNGIYLFDREYPTYDFSDNKFYKAGQWKYNEAYSGAGPTTPSYDSLGL